MKPEPEFEPLAADQQALLKSLAPGLATPAMKAQLWQRIEASSVAMSAAPSSDVQAPAAGSASAASSASAAGQAAPVVTMLGKLGAPLMLGAFIAGGAAAVAVDRTWFAPEPKVQWVERVVVQPAPVVVPQPVPVPVPGPVALPRPVPQPTPLPLSKPPVVEPRQVQAGVPSSEERQLLESARTALLKGNPGAALEALSTHRETFATGQLAEERDSLEVQALVLSGRAAEAREAAKRFMAKYPQSIFGPAVEAATAL